ncbi:hypothetical protein CJO78_13480 [Ralstonia solanacearum]|nr:hypothetical protein CJO76_13025 [Ralstonia solanacearum]AXV87231.1 hypothetical protein CJO78_13480 [Ralstonia solanacearum]AXV91831.1 hypothetical protein CJO79_13005 [Ralstonia solanacearum]AXW06719.1 hypothetical protein CJO82_13260 [Ralstonia solanacearum]AXW19926.1 hypothetical protein CJO85_13065 [Ralstonia solanacearum]
MPAGRCSVAHLTEQRSGQTSGCLEAFLAHACIDAAGRGRAGTTRIDGENGAVRMEIGKNVPIP